MTSHQIKTINRDIKENYQVEILDLKTTITEMENSLECLNNKSEQAEERISTFEYRSITQSEEYKGKKGKKINRASEMWGRPTSMLRQV